MREDDRWINEGDGGDFGRHRSCGIGNGERVVADVVFRDGILGERRGGGSCDGTSIFIPLKGEILADDDGLDGKSTAVGGKADGGWFGNDHGADRIAPCGAGVGGW